MYQKDSNLMYYTSVKYSYVQWSFKLIEVDFMIQILV